MLPYALIAVIGLVLYCWLRTSSPLTVTAGAEQSTVLPTPQGSSRFVRWLLAWFDPASSRIGWRAAAAAWAFLCFVPVIHGWIAHRTPLYSDSLTSNLPLKYLAIEQMKEGRLPLWTSRLGCGSPLLADTISLPFDPRNLWFLLLSPVSAYWAMLITSRLLNGWIALAYLRQRHGLAYGPALVALVIYLFGNLFAEESRLHSTAVILESLPGILWLTERLLDRPGLGRMLALSAAWAALFFIGSIAYLVYLPPLAFTWAIALWLAGQPRAPARKLAGFAGLYGLALVWAVCLCGVTFVPFVELVRMSNRGGEYPIDPFAFRSLFSLIVGAQPTSRFMPSYSFFFYVGVTGLPFLLTCWLRRDTPYLRAATWLSVLTLVGLIITTSPLKPHLVRYMPVFATVAFFRLSFFWGLLAAILIAHGIQRSMQGLDPAAIRTARVLGWIQLGPALLCPLLAFWLIMVRMEAEKTYAEMREMMESFLWTTFLTLTFLRLGGLLHLWRPASPSVLRPRVASAACFLLLEVLLAWLLIVYPASTPVDLHYPETQEVAYLREHNSPDYRINGLILRPGSNPVPGLVVNGDMPFFGDSAAVHGLRTINCYESLIPREYGEFINCYGDLDWRRVLCPRATNAVMWTSVHDSPLADAQGVRFLIAQEYLPRTAALKPRLFGRSYLIYERTHPLPRSYFVSSARHGSHQQVIDWLAELQQDYAALSNFDAERQSKGLALYAACWWRFAIACIKPETNLRREVLLEGDDSSEEQGASAPDSEAVPGHIVADRDSEVEVAVSCPKRGHVVLSDTYFPGWKAWVDGREVPIVRANGFARAVPVSAGDHVIVFRYQPASLVWGLRLTASSFAAWALALTWLIWRRRRQQQPQAQDDTMRLRAA